MSIKRRRTTCGLSLVELLVVLVAVGILASVLYPVISSARHKSKDAACSTNMQQIGHALALYTADYDGNYPQTIDAVFVGGTADNAQNSATWRMRLLVYLNQHTFPHCLATLPLPDVDSEVHSGDFSGYTLNDNLNAPSSFGALYVHHGIQEARLQHPSMSIVVAEARAGIIGQKQPDTARTTAELKQEAVYYDILASLICTQPSGALRHHGGANYAFADGHVKWLLPSQLSAASKSDGITPGFGL